MTVAINMTAKEAIELARAGFPPEDAIQMAVSNADALTRARGRRLSAAERERIEAKVYEEAR